MALPVPRRWAPWHLLLASFGYWIALVLGVLGPPAILVWRLTHEPASHARVTASLTNDMVSLAVADGSATHWAGSASILTVALWVIVPPMSLYIVWLRSRPVRRALAHDAAGETDPGLATPGRDGTLVRAGSAPASSDPAGDRRSKAPPLASERPLAERRAAQERV